MELKEALNTLRSTFNDMKITMKSLTSLFQVQNAFTQYTNIITNGLKIMKNPINQVMNQINTLMDVSFLKRLEGNLESTLEEVKDTSMACVTNIKAEVEEIVKYFKEYPSTILDDLSNVAKSQAENLLKRLLAKVISKIISYDFSKDNYTPPRRLLRTYIPLFGVPLCFDVNFAYGYHYGLKIGVENMDIKLHAYGGGEATIEASAYISLLVVRFGGRITGLLGRGSVSIGPSFSLANFQVFLQGSITLQAFEFKAYVFMSLLLPKFEIKCGWFFCIIYITFRWKTFDYGLDIFKGYKYDNTIEKIY